MSGEKTPGLAIVGFILFVDMLGVGLIMPVMPRLIADINGAGPADAAKIGGWLLFVYAAMQFLCAPVIGGLSDRFGRRPVLLVTLFLLGIDYAVMALAPSLTWLFAGRALSGVMGASWAAANSCVADAVVAERRGAAFGLLGGAGAAGFVLGPALGGIAGEFDPRLPFMVASVLALAGAVAGLFLLKETLPPSRRRPFDITRANPLGSILRIARVRFVLACLGVAFLMQLSAQAQFSIWAYWGELTFGWTPLTSGLTVTLYGLLLGLFQAGLTGRAIARLGPARTARYGLLFGLPSYIVLALATSTPMVLAAILIGTVSGVTFPAMQQMMTARIDEDSQGELQGAISSTISLTSVIGPVMMTQVFSRFSDNHGLYFPGAPYVLSLGLLTLGCLLLWRTTRGANAAQHSCN